MIHMLCMQCLLAGLSPGLFFKGHFGGPPDHNFDSFPWFLVWWFKIEARNGQGRLRTCIHLYVYWGFPLLAFTRVLRRWLNRTSARRCPRRPQLLDRTLLSFIVAPEQLNSGRNSHQESDYVSTGFRSLLLLCPTMSISRVTNQGYQPHARSTVNDGVFK